MLLPPVQTLVATLIFAFGENANESCRPHQSPKGVSLWGFPFYLFTKIS
jgi:hypothetical protein